MYFISSLNNFMVDNDDDEEIASEPETLSLYSNPHQLYFTRIPTEQPYFTQIPWYGQPYSQPFVLYTLPLPRKCEGCTNLCYGQAADLLHDYKPDSVCNKCCNMLNSGLYYDQFN